MELSLFLPFFAFLFSLTHSERVTAYTRILMCVGSVGFSLLISIYLFFIPDHNILLGSWFSIGLLHINFEFLFDPLTKIMLFVISFISFLVNIYSIDYMRDDPELALFISYLSLFTFFMFILVSSANFALLFLGWEGVGLSSYLLINFWHTRVNAQKSAIKAVIVNKIGDVLLMYFFAALFFSFKTLDYYTIFALAPFCSNKIFILGLPIIDVMCIFLLGGAAAKSAQLGLHTWLPDAMEGPSPVSALIHAATMVTAGIFLLVRCSPLLEFSEFTLSFATVLGSLTAFFAATVALCQHDVKRVIAYSTCSQLGYMLFAIGLSGYGFAMFHLFNHAFFKAALFLSAGSIIHSLTIEQDLRRMGGLHQLLPLAFVSTFFGSLSLMGFPFLSGFYSKDAILELAFSHSSVGFFAYILGSVSAFLTSLYSIRLLILVFLSKPNTFRNYVIHTHDAPLLMAFALIILFAPSIVSGYFAHEIFFSSFWKQSIFVLPYHFSNDIEFLSPFIKIFPTLLSFLGAFAGYLLFFKHVLWTVYKPLYTFLYLKWYIDTVINKAFVFPFLYFGRLVTFEMLDQGFFEIWGARGIAKIFNTAVSIEHLMQNGLIYEYLTFFICGISFVIDIIHHEPQFYRDFFIALPLVIGIIHSYNYGEELPHSNLSVTNNK